jgi:hypothetical protein
LTCKIDKWGKQAFRRKAKARKIRPRPASVARMQRSGIRESADVICFPGFHFIPSGLRLLTLRRHSAQ